MPAAKPSLLAASKGERHGERRDRGTEGPGEHRHLGHDLVGRMLRYVACDDDDWVALGCSDSMVSMSPGSGS
jgi:hypothetical protein